MWWCVEWVCWGIVVGETTSKLGENRTSISEARISNREPKMSLIV